MEAKERSEMVDAFQRFLQTDNFETIGKFTKRQINEVLSTLATMDLNKPFADAMRNRIKELGEVERLHKTKWRRLAWRFFEFMMIVLATIIGQFFIKILRLS